MPIAHHVLSRDGYVTVVGERGLKVPGGDKQRVAALARVRVISKKNPKTVNLLSVQVGNTCHILGGISKRQQVFVPRLQPDGRPRTGLAFALFLLIVVVAGVAIPKDDLGEFARIFAEFQHPAVINVVGTPGGYPLQRITEHGRAKVVLADGAVVIIPGCIGRSHENAKPRGGG
jgi:hypothetical protein